MNNLNIAANTYELAIKRIFILAQQLIGVTEFKLPNENDRILFIVELMCSDTDKNGFEFSMEEISDNELRERIAKMCGYAQVKDAERILYVANEVIPNVPRDTFGEVSKNVTGSLSEYGPMTKIQFGEEIPEHLQVKMNAVPPIWGPGNPQIRSAKSLARMDMSPAGWSSRHSFDVRRNVAESQRNRLSDLKQRRQTRKNMDIVATPGNSGKTKKRSLGFDTEGETENTDRKTRRLDETETDPDETNDKNYGGKKPKRKSNKKRKTQKKQNKKMNKNHKGKKTAKNKKHRK